MLFELCGFVKSYDLNPTQPPTRWVKLNWVSCGSKLHTPNLAFWLLLFFLTKNGNTEPQQICSIFQARRRKGRRAKWIVVWASTRRSLSSFSTPLYLGPLSFSCHLQIMAINYSHQSAATTSNGFPTFSISMFDLLG